MSKEALDLALEALETCDFVYTYGNGGYQQFDRPLVDKAITAIKQAPSAPVQPVSGVVLRDGYPTLIQDKHIKETDQRLCILPTTPPAQQELVQEPLKHSMVAHELAQKELARLVKENFGQMPRNDKWADSVLDLRDALESQQNKEKMKAYCKNCQVMQPSSFRPAKDAVTESHYEDLCCDSCHFVVATIQEREAAAQPPVQEPVNQRAHEMALRQWESWKQYALELQEKLVKYEGGAPMVLNTTPPAAQRMWVDLTPQDLNEIFKVANTGEGAVYLALEKVKEKNT